MRLEAELLPVAEEELAVEVTLFSTSGFLGFSGGRMVIFLIPDDAEIENINPLVHSVQ